MNQREYILKKLQDQPVCGGELLKAGIARYSARVHELRQEGHRIVSTPCKAHEHVAAIASFELLEPVAQPALF